MKMKIEKLKGALIGYGAIAHNAHAPALRGCWSQGHTRDEVLANIREAIAAWLETEQDKADHQTEPADIELINV